MRRAHLDFLLSEYNNGSGTAFAKATSGNFRVWRADREHEFNALWRLRGVAYDGAPGRDRVLARLALLAYDRRVAENGEETGRRTADLCGYGKQSGATPGSLFDAWLGKTNEANQRLVAVLEGHLLSEKPLSEVALVVEAFPDIVSDIRGCGHVFGRDFARAWRKVEAVAAELMRDDAFLGAIARTPGADTNLERCRLVSAFVAAPDYARLSLPTKADAKHVSGIGGGFKHDLRHAVERVTDRVALALDPDHRAGTERMLEDGTRLVYGADGKLVGRQRPGAELESMGERPLEPGGPKR